MAGRIQKQDIKTEAELISAGATKSSLPQDTQVYVTANGINKTFYQAVVDGDIGSSPGLPTIQSFTSGSGTYTTPANAKYLRLRMVGGGGGGGSTGSSGAASGGGGTSTSFSSFTAGPGGGGGFGDSSSAIDGGAGGTVTGSPNLISQAGQPGHIGLVQGTSLVPSVSGGDGGGSPFFGGKGKGTRGSAGSPGITNSGGGGGGGAGNTATFPASGGGAGAYIETFIFSPSATYPYAVGAGGAGASAGTSGFAGGAGAAGIIIVEEYY